MHNFSVSKISPSYKSYRRFSAQISDKMLSSTIKLYQTGGTGVWNANILPSQNRNRSTAQCATSPPAGGAQRTIADIYEAGYIKRRP
jgi:hypothetical protein